MGQGVNVLPGGVLSAEGGVVTKGELTGGSLKVGSLASVSPGDANSGNIGAISALVGVSDSGEIKRVAGGTIDLSASS